MHSHDPSDAEIPQGSVVNPPIDEMIKLGYDTRDVDFGALAKAIFAFMVFTTISAVGGIITVWGLDKLNGTQMYGAKTEPPLKTSPLAIKGAPRLQTDVTAALDIEKLRFDENVRLTTYGWVDETKGIVRLPVEVALERVLEKGLPERTSPGESMTSEPSGMGDSPTTTVPNPDAPISSDTPTGTTESPPTVAPNGQEIHPGG